MTATATTRPARAVVRSTATLVAFAVTGYLIALTYQQVAHNRMAPWIVGRATGVCAYLLLDALVIVGLVLATPRSDGRSGRTPARIRLHVSLSLFTTAVIALHVVVLALDRYAGVGWWGALLPLQASYRPFPVSLGVVAIWFFVLAGLTASAAGHLPRRAWWPLHKIAIATFVLVWFHGVLAGSDTTDLRPLYVATGSVTLAIALWRYRAAQRQGTP